MGHYNPCAHSRLFSSRALSTPCGWSGDGLPIGLQIVARPWQDGLTLRVARAYAEASGFPDYARTRPRLDA